MSFLVNNQMKPQSIKMWCMVSLDNKLFLEGNDPLFFRTKKEGERIKKNSAYWYKTKIKRCKIII